MKHLKLFLFLFFIAIFTNCQKNDEIFENKVYIKNDTNKETVYFKKGVSDQLKEFVVEVAKPLDETLKLSVGVDNSKVLNFNSIYNQKAKILPKNNYELKVKNAEIEKGAVTSNKIGVNFKELGDLDRETLYVLPIGINSSNLAVLQSKKVHYYVFKGAALINDVANISKNYLSINWKNGDVCDNLKAVTLEALIKAKSFDRLISTIMGIEGGYLIRIGDAGWPSNQIQIACARDNFPDPNEKFGLPINEWIHIACTHDVESKTIILYINGAKQCEGTMDVGSSISLSRGNFFIGKSYNDDRYFDGEISEVRIWNKIRTAKEISENPYYVDPTSEGLVAYWKFNDKDPIIIKDHSGNENHAKANKDLTWVPVEIPKKN